MRRIYDYLLKVGLFRVHIKLTWVPAVINLQRTFKELDKRFHPVAHPLVAGCGMKSLPLYVSSLDNNKLLEKIDEV